MFDWARMVEEVNYAMSEAVSIIDWHKFNIYGPNTTGFDAKPSVCFEARVTSAALNGLREYIAAQGAWLLPVGIHVAAELVQ